MSGKELLVGKVGAEHEENVAVFHGVVAGAETDQAGESYVVGVVVLDVLFAAEGVDDGGFQGFCGGHQLGVCVLAAGSAEDGDFLSGVEDVSGFAEFLVVGADDGFGYPDGRLAVNSSGALCRATSPGMTRTATPERLMAVRMAMSRTRGICSGMPTISQ